MNIGRTNSNIIWRMSMLQILLLRLIRPSKGFGPVSSSIFLSRPNSLTQSCRPFSLLHQSSPRTPPPEFSFLDDDVDDENGDNESKVEAKAAEKTPWNWQEEQERKSQQGPPRFEDSGPDFSIDFDEDGEVAIQASKSSTPQSPKQRSATTSRSYSSTREPRRPSAAGATNTVSPKASWMDRNNAFRDAGDGGSPRTFREDFRGTRVFVQNLPPQTSWQDLKDHFRLAGDVVFASVSGDAQTGVSKGCGIVQFETTDMAQNAIQVMGQYPLDGYTLSVRKDVQEGKAGASLRASSPRTKGPTPPTKWKCADEGGASQLSTEEETGVRMLIKERDFARRRKDYDLSDEIREQLKTRYGVHIDDRLKMWWTSFDGKTVPATVQAIKGDGKWVLDTWRMIPTTRENDACVNPDLVNGLLAQRDIARREKDFATADALLDQARNSPDGDLSLRIHDESRTWRIWTEERPNFPSRPTKKSPAEQCLAITEEFAPERVEEIKRVLEHFPGREYNILKKLKQQFNV